MFCHLGHQVQVASNPTRLHQSENVQELRSIIFCVHISPNHADQGTTPKPLPSPPPAPTWPSTTSSAAGSRGALPSTLSVASSSHRRYRQLSSSSINHAYASIPDSWRSPLLAPPSKELGRRPASSAAAGDAAAELRSAREDVKQLLKDKSCHPILVSLRDLVVVL